MSDRFFSSHRGVVANCPHCEKCGQQGLHLCEPRAKRVKTFFEKVLMHTKGYFAEKPFILASFQWDDILRPLFGYVEYDDHWEQYVRKYTVAWIEIARKNGKSELMAGIALYLLTVDQEKGADIYGVARDREQAGIVFNVAATMVQLSEYLALRLRVVKSDRMIIYDEPGKNSFYTTLPADDLGNLGLNPHGVVLDEALAQRNDKLATVLRQGMGTRVQPLMVCGTTAGTRDAEYYMAEHKYALRVIEDPEIDPARFVYLRTVPDELDGYDEANWPLANPGLEAGFLSLNFLRKEARLAKNDPTKEADFFQYHLNRIVSKVTRFFPMVIYDKLSGDHFPNNEATALYAQGQRCFSGLDLSATLDLTSLCHIFPDLDNFAIWRYWIPEGTVDFLDKHTAGNFSVWVKQGWVTTCPGNAIDYQMVQDQIQQDRKTFNLIDLNYDPMLAADTIQRLEKLGLTSVQVKQGFQLDAPLKKLLEWMKTDHFHPGGNPVSRWNFEACEVKRDDRDRVYYVKPRRDNTGRRIDGVAAAVMATDGIMRRGNSTVKKFKAVGF